MKYSTKQISDRLRQLGFAMPTGVHLIGVRSKADKPNEFDDQFYFYCNGRHETLVMPFTGTTNPGSHWLTNLLNPNGAFILKPGQYLDCWTLGKHKGAYDAWVQAKPVAGYRDSNKDGKSDAVGRIYIGMFGINIHRASPNRVSRFIDKWSAGCQVFNDPVQYDFFIRESKASKQEYFSYTLLDEW